MNSYLIKKDNKTNEIIYMECTLEGYNFSPGERTKRALRVENITIIKPDLIQKVVKLKFNKLFKKITLKVYEIMKSDDEDNGDTALMLSEISRLKEIINNIYHKYISKEQEKQFLLKLEILEKELQYKRLIMEQSYENQHETSMRR